MTIDGTPRRPFFERVPEARPPFVVAFAGPEVNAALCRAFVDGWARTQDCDDRDVSGQVDEVLWQETDDAACRAAHRLADAMGVEP